MRIIFLFCVCLFLLISGIAKAQKDYSIDLHSPASRSVSINFLIQQNKKKIKESLKHHKEKRVEYKISKKIRKHTYAIQTRDVKKRMKKSRKQAEQFNDGHISLVNRILIFFRYG